MIKVSKEWSLVESDYQLFGLLGQKKTLRFQA
jgi:hypothetical protein